MSNVMGWMSCFKSNMFMKQHLKVQIKMVLLNICMDLVDLLNIYGLNELFAMNLSMNELYLLHLDGVRLSNICLICSIFAWICWFISLFGCIFCWIFMGLMGWMSCLP